MKHTIERGRQTNGTMRYKWQHGMPFLSQYNGGIQFPQVFAAPLYEPASRIPAFTDDTIFASGKRQVFQLVVMLETANQINDVNLELDSVISPDPAVLDLAQKTYVVHSHTTNYRPNGSSQTKLRIEDIDAVRVLSGEEYAAAGLADIQNGGTFPRPAPVFYNPDCIRTVLGEKARFVIVRWDRIVFAACRNVQELQHAMDSIASCLHQDQSDLSKL